MALLVVTDDQKLLLKNSSRFQSLISLGIQRKAKFWQNVDPTNTTLLTNLGGGNLSAGYTRWRKSIAYSFMYTQHPVNSEDQELVRIALLYLTQTVWDSATPDVSGMDAAINVMIASANAILDAVCDAVFDERIKNAL